MLKLQLTRPSEAELELLLPGLVHEPYTYAHAGASKEEPLPDGYRHLTVRRRVGDASKFDTAKAAIERFGAQRGSGLIVASSGSVAPDVVVAQAAKLPIAGWVLATCRVVYVVDEPDRFMWAYGTLGVHPEIGEERFTLIREGNDLFYEVAAFSNASGLLIKLGGPITWRIQAQSVERYIDAVTLAANA